MTFPRLAKEIQQDSVPQKNVMGTESLCSVFMFEMSLQMRVHLSSLPLLPLLQSTPNVLSFFGSNKVLDFVFTNIKNRSTIGSVGA